MLKGKKSAYKPNGPPGQSFAENFTAGWSVRAKSLAQEHNTMSPARPQSRVKQTNQGATVPTLWHNVTMTVIVKTRETLNSFRTWNWILSKWERKRSRDIILSGKYSKLVQVEHPKDWTLKLTCSSCVLTWRTIKSIATLFSPPWKYKTKFAL